jgi:hypothetical protein
MQIPAKMERNSRKMLSTGRCAFAENFRPRQAMACIDSDMTGGWPVVVARVTTVR